MLHSINRQQHHIKAIWGLAGWLNRFKCGGIRPGLTWMGPIKLLASVGRQGLPDLEALVLGLQTVWSYRLSKWSLAAYTYSKLGNYCDDAHGLALVAMGLGS